MPHHQLQALRVRKGAPLRPTWDEYWNLVAKVVATRADCTRSKVGAILVAEYDKRVISTGYNGSPPGGPSCLAGECPRGIHFLAVDEDEGEDYCGGCGEGWPCSSSQMPGSSYDTGEGVCIALHAEQNAILWSSPVDRRGSTLYITRAPCEGCWRLIRGVGIKRVLVNGVEQ